MQQIQKTLAAVHNTDIGIPKHVPMNITMTYIVLVVGKWTTVLEAKALMMAVHMMVMLVRQMKGLHR